LRFTLDILDAAGLNADPNKVGANSNLLNSYINFLNVLGQNQTAENKNEPPYNRISLYLRVPFNEPQFSINTNTRIISVPASFSGNGIGVVGDHLAEILFFTMPRFFDAMDLYLCDIRIVWQNANGDEHIYKPLAIDPEGDVLTFGWALTKDVTAIAGTINFAIEFVHKNVDTNEVDFRLNTQAAQVSVQNGLELTGEEPEIEEQEEIVYSRAIYSNVINLLSADPAIIISDLDPSQNTLGENGTITMSLNATSSDYENKVTYEWQWNNISVDQPEGTFINLDNTYTLVDEKSIVFADPAEKNSDGTAKEGSTYKTLTTNVPGTYNVYIGNQTPSGGKRYITSKTVVIEPANNFTLYENNMPAVAYFTEDNAKLQVSAENNNGTITYKWYHNDEYVTENTTGILELDNRNSVVLNGYSDYTSLRGPWKVIAENVLNNSKRVVASATNTFMEVIPKQLVKDVDVVCEQASQDGIRKDVFILTFKNVPYDGAQYRYYVDVSVNNTPTNNGTLNQGRIRAIYPTDITVPDGESTYSISLNLEDFESLTAGDPYYAYIYVLRGTRLGEEYERIPVNSYGEAAYTEFIIEAGAYKSVTRPVTKLASTVEDIQQALTVGGKLILQNDIAISEPLVLDKNITIDLNGRNLSRAEQSGALFNVTDGAVVTLTGNGNVSAGYRVAEVTDGSLIVDSGNYTATKNNCFRADGENAQITINGGTITGQEGAVLVFNGATATITGGVLTGLDNSPVATNGTPDVGGNTILMSGGELVGNIQSAGYEAVGLYIANNDTFVMSGGKITANNGCGICQRAGSVTIGPDAIIEVTGVEGFTGKVGDAKNALSQSAIVFDMSQDYPGAKLEPAMSLTVAAGAQLTGVAKSIDVLNVSAVTGEVYTPNITVAEGALCTPPYEPVVIEEPTEEPAGD